MNFKLHNKYEITVGDKKYIAYNTLLNTIYNKISNLEQFTSHIAIGTGTTQKTVNDTNLGNYLMTFKAKTDEIQCDVSKETLFIKKVVTIDESFTETFSFSELGITNTSTFDPIIFNHVLLKNQEGEVVSVTRNPGDAMEIKVTIYLELTPESKDLFVQGENELIKCMLGEELDIKDNNLYAVRGLNVLNDKLINNCEFDLTDAVICEKTTNQNDDGTITLNYVAELGEGKVEEILILFNNKVCLKLNALEMKNTVSLSNTYSCASGNYIEVDDFIKSIYSVYMVNDEGENTLHSTHGVVNFSKQLANKVSNVFDKNFNASVPRYVSKDGLMIAFIYESYMHLYKFEDYAFNKINTVNVSTENILNVIMFEDKILIVRTSEPYINVYKIENYIAVKKEVNLSMFDSSVYSYNWIECDATLTQNNKILLGVILNNEARTPIVITLTENESGNYTDDFRKAKIDTARKVYSIYKNNYAEPRISFITDTYLNGTYYLIEEYFESSTMFASNSDTAYKLLNNTKGLTVSGRVIASQKDNAPYLVAYYYPNFEETSNVFSSGIKHYFSKDGSYVIAKYSDNTYKIFNLHEIDNLIEFENGFPAFVDFNVITDFEFVGDYLLVFTSNSENSIYAIALKKAYTRIENLEDVNKSYLINYSKYDLLGNKTLEGVKATFSVNFNTKGE